MLGRVFNSLSHIVEAKLRHWRQDNKLDDENRWDRLEILFQRQRRDVLDVVLIFGGVIVFATMFFVYLESIDLQANNTWQRFDDWDFTIAGMSLAVMALIVPLALGFVGAEVKSKSAMDVFWDIYLDYCRPGLLVVSSLAHLTFILGSQLLEPFLPEAFSLALSMGGLLWMIINASIMGWFFKSTFSLVGTNTRYKVVEKYVLNRELPQDIEHRLRVNVSVGAVDAGYIWRPEGAEREDVFDVHSYSPFADEWRVFQSEYSSQMQVKNIYYRLLNLAVKRIYRTVKKKAAENRGVDLYLPPEAGDIGKVIVFAKYQGFEIDLTSKFLIYMSYYLTQQKAPARSQLLTYLEVLPGQVRDAVRDVNEQQFKLELRRMVRLFAAVFSAASHTDERIVQNWLELQTGILEVNAVEQMLQHFLKLTNEVLDRIDRQPSFFHEMVYVMPNLSRMIEKPLSAGVTRSLIRFHWYQWLSLLRSRSISAGAEEAIDEKLEIALTRFISSWEYWQHHSYLDSLNWEAVRDRDEPGLELHINTLERTGEMLISSLDAGDIEAANWMADMLIRWCDGVVQEDTNFDFEWRSSHLTLGHLGHNLDEPMVESLLSSEINLQTNVENLRDRAVKIATANYWKDILIVTAAILLTPRFANNAQLAQSFALKLVANGEFVRGEQRNGVHQLRITGQEFRAFLVRTLVTNCSDLIRYACYLDHFIEECAGIDESPRISGRVYSRSGVLDLSSLTTELHLIAINSDAVQFDAGDEFQRLTRSMEYESLEQVIRNLEAFQANDDVRLSQISERLGLERAIVDERFERLGDSLSGLIANVKAQNAEQMQGAEVDLTKLQDLERSLEALAFDDQKIKFPASLFLETRYLANVEQSGIQTQIFKVTGYRTQDIAAGFPDHNRNHDNEWYGRYFNSKVSETLHRLLWEQIKDSSLVECESNEDLVTEVLSKSSSEASGLVLVANRLALQHYLREREWDSRKPSSTENSVRRDSNFGDGYICHIGAVPVFKGLFRDVPNYLVPRSYFKTLKFMRTPEGAFVKVDFQQDDAAPETGEITIKSWFEPEWAETGATLIDSPH